MDCSYWLYYRLDRLRSPSLKYSRQQYGTLTGPRNSNQILGHVADRITQQFLNHWTPFSIFEKPTMRNSLKRLY